MIAGVAVFIGAYTFVTSTDWFARFVKRPFVRRTLFIGYGIRLGCSAIFPVGMAVDLVPGLISISPHFSPPLWKKAGLCAISVLSENAYASRRSQPDVRRV